MKTWRNTVQDTTTKMRLLMQDKFSTRNMLSQAIRGATHVPLGEAFIVEDLFDPYFWSAVPAMKRRELGRLFAANTDGEKREHIEKTTPKAYKNI